MAWSVEVTDEFEAWWSDLSEEQQSDVEAIVQLLEERGTALSSPFSSRINGSRHSHIRELRVQSAGCPVRLFYAFDPRRTAIILIGGDKTGNDRFYAEMIPVADRLYDVYLEELRKEGLI